MCGHGTIGLIASLQFAGRLAPGSVRIDTPVGAVQARLHEDGEVSVENVASHRTAREVARAAAGRSAVTGDVAWGGNWFFLDGAPRAAPGSRPSRGLTDFTRRVRGAVNARRTTAKSITWSFSVRAAAPRAHSRNFVLCPGKAYDRSPCGTGSSAKLACLAADGRLEEDEPWVQESMIGSTFAGTLSVERSRQGRDRADHTRPAHVTGEASLHLDPADPFCWGIRALTRVTIGCPRGPSRPRTPSHQPADTAAILRALERS